MRVLPRAAMLLAGAALVAVPSTAGAAEQMPDSFTFAGYSGRGGAEGLDATFVVPRVDCALGGDPRAVFPGAMVWSTGSPLEYLTGGAGVELRCADGVMTYRPVLINSADAYVVDRPVAVGDKIRVQFLPDGPDVATARITNKTQGWSEETVRFGTVPVTRAEVSTSTFDTVPGEDLVLQPPTTRFTKVRVDGRRLGKDTLQAFNLDYGRGDPLLVPSAVKKGGFKVHKWEPQP